jgi:hypothetical protein
MLLDTPLLGFDTLSLFDHYKQCIYRYAALTNMVMNAPKCSFHEILGRWEFRADPVQAKSGDHYKNYTFKTSSHLLFPVNSPATQDCSLSPFK